MSRNRRPNVLKAALAPLHRLPGMGRLLQGSAVRPGTAPGTLEHRGTQKVDRVRISYFDYDATEFSEGEVDSIRDCLGFADSERATWVNIEGVHDVEVIRALGDRFGWHPLMLEDIVSLNQRSKAEDYEDYLYIVLPMLRWNEELGAVEAEQLSLVLGKRYVFTFQERPGDVFDTVRERLRGAKGRIRARACDYLAYALTDAVVDSYFGILERIGDVTERLEEEVLLAPRQETMQRLHQLKRELISVRRGVWPLREMLSALARAEGDHFTKETRVFLRDVYDHAVQVVDIVEALRDVVSGAVDLYLSSVSYRTNEIMKVLTVMASIFIPLTFCAGVYGMNFDYMPELHYTWGYPALLGSMAVMALAMLAFFRWKSWV